jgi:drug/metabolite transporter (DMT)-like permease
VLMMALTVSVVWVLQGTGWHNPVWQAWVGIGVLALVPTYLARLTLFAAVKRLGGGQVSLLGPFETFLTVIWAIRFLGDRLSLSQLAGGALIILSAVLAVQRLRRAKVVVEPI